MPQKMRGANVFLDHTILKLSSGRTFCLMTSDGHRIIIEPPPFSCSGQLFDPEFTPEMSRYGVTESEFGAVVVHLREKLHRASKWWCILSIIGVVVMIAMLVAVGALLYIIITRDMFLLIVGLYYLIFPSLGVSVAFWGLGAYIRIRTFNNLESDLSKFNTERYHWWNRTSKVVFGQVSLRQIAIEVLPTIGYLSTAVNDLDLDEEQNEDMSHLTEENECLICYARIAKVQFHPCNHKIVCRSCLQKISICPMCRADIESFTIHDHETAETTQLQRGESNL